MTYWCWSCFRLNSLEYRDFKEKLKDPIRNARNIVIHQNLSDRFVEAFKAQVEQNPRYHLPSGNDNPVSSVCAHYCLSSFSCNLKLNGWYQICDGVHDTAVIVTAHQTLSLESWLEMSTVFSLEVIVIVVVVVVLCFYKTVSSLEFTTLSA